MVFAHPLNIRSNTSRLGRFLRCSSVAPAIVLHRSICLALGPLWRRALIVAFGTRRDRYQDAYEVQCYSGIALTYIGQKRELCILPGGPEDAVIA
jgi:hypothetical protein